MDEIIFFLPEFLLRIVGAYHDPFPEVKYDKSLTHRKKTPFEDKCDLAHLKELKDAYFPYEISRKKFVVSDDILEEMMHRAYLRQWDYPQRPDYKGGVRNYRKKGDVPWRGGEISTIACLGNDYVICSQPVTGILKDGDMVLVFPRDDSHPIAEYYCERRSYYDEYEPGYFSWNRNTELSRAMYIILTSHME